MNSKKMVFSILGVFLIGCTNRASDNAILETSAGVGIAKGVASEENSPAALSTVALTLSFGSQPSSICTGTIISEDVILTATHCLKSDSTESLRIKLGTNMEAQDAMNPLLEIEGFVTNPLYKTVTLPEDESKDITVINDVAVIKLKNKIPAPFKPAAVIDSDLILPNDTELLLAGWGYSSYALLKGTDTNVLLEAKVKLHGYWATQLLTNQLDGKGACMGDSGGPAFITDQDGTLVVVGATKGALQPYGKCDYFVEYSNLSIFKKFITDSIEKLGGTQPVFVTPKIASPHIFDTTEPTDFNKELLPLRPPLETWPTPRKTAK